MTGDEIRNRDGGTMEVRWRKLFLTLSHSFVLILVYWGLVGVI